MSPARVRAQLALLHHATSHGISRADALLSAGALAGRPKARLAMLCAFMRAWRSRLMARMEAHGRPLTLAPPEVLEVGTPLQELEHLVHLCEVLAERFAKAAQLAREAADLSTAWVCELNRVEALDAAGELRRMLEPERAVGT